MAKDFLSYLKDAADSLFNGKENEEKRNKAIEDLTAYLHEAAQVGELPEKPDIDTPSYERLEVQEKSDEEIRSLAESLLEGYKNSSETAIDKELDLAAEKLSAEKASAEKAASQSSQSIEEAYGTAKKEVDDDLLRRGLARSSIAANKNAALSDAKAQKAAAIAAELNSAVAALDASIASLGKEREKALADFNIAYAAKLTEKITELTAEQEKKRTEALKYNNTLTEKEHEAELDAQQKEADIYGKELSNTEKERALSASTDPNLSTYKKMCEILDSLNPNDARALVMEKAIFRDNLSDYYYYKLYDRYTRE